MKRIINYSIVIALCLGTIAPLSAQVISLDTILQRIEKTNPMLREYDSKANAYNAYAAGAKAWMAPMIGVGPYWYPYPGQTLMSEGEKGMLMATIEQDIPNPAKLKARKNYFDSRANVELQSRLVAYNNLRAEARENYYRWLVAIQKLKALEQNQRVLDVMLKTARARYPYNQGSLSSIYKTEALIEEVKNMQLMIEGDIEASRSRLAALMNRTEDRSFTIDTTTVVERAVIDGTLESRRSDVRKIDETIEVMRLNQQVQRSQAKPDFRIRFEHMDPRGEGMPKQFTAMAMISIPIAPWSSKMYKAEVKGMEYDIEAMQRNRESILLEANGMISGMSSKISRMNQQLDNYDLKIIPALRRNYETLIIAYQENREQLPMVLDAAEALSMTQITYLEKREEYYLMIVAYEKELEK